MQAATKLVITADPAAKADAKRLISRIGAQAAVLSAEEASTRDQSGASVLYLKGTEPMQCVQASLEKIANIVVELIVYAVVPPSPKISFEWGKLCERVVPGKNRGIVSSPTELADVLLGAATQEQTSQSEAGPLSVEGLRKSLGLTQVQLAKAAEVSTRTIQSWEREKRSLAGSRSLQDLAELRKMLLGHVEERNIPDWLREPNEMLKGKAPLDVLQQGHTRDLLWQLRSAATGQPA